MNVRLSQREEFGAVVEQASWEPQRRRILYCTLEACPPLALTPVSLATDDDTDLVFLLLISTQIHGVVRG